MRRFLSLSALVLSAFGVAISLPLCAQSANPAASCIECHSKQTPNIVSDWRLSKHSQVEVTCVWYGWSEMQRDLTEIRELAEQMRREKKTGPMVKPAALK